MCIDYRGLNAITVKNREPLPRIDDLLDRVQGCRYFSKIDLKSGYHQIAIRHEDQHKTTFQTRYGLYEFVVMPFGLCNAPGTFQHAMNRIFHDYLDKFVIVYLHDILIFSKTVEEHVAHLDKVLGLLRQHKFKINGEKCEFGRTRVLYLGHEISAEGLNPDDAKVASIRDWPRPQSVTEMRSFLGMTGYYRTFVKNYSIVAAPLTDLTCLDTPWEWTDECEAAFRHLKHALTHYEVLKLLDPDKPFIVTTDASQYGIGAVLAQQEGPKLRPVEYMSKKMLSQKLAKSTYEKELYAVYKALTHWRHYLLGQFFILRTDHQTLRWMRTHSVLSDALKRWIEVIEQYDFDPQYLKREYNKVVDALSRRPDFSGALITEFDLTDNVTQSLVEAYREDQFMYIEDEAGAMAPQMRRKGIGLDQVYDARALRVIVGDGGGRWHVQAVEGCYHLLSIVHSLWPPICGEFDDYIVNPKPSGYQSLHTAVTGPDGAPLEVQIRTQGMHEQAEYGHAAHWMYKEERDMMDYATNAFPNAAGNEGGDTGRANGAKIINGDMLGMAQMVNANLSSEDDNEQQCEGRGLPARQQWGMWSPGHPALRVHQGKLLAAVVIRVENGGRELIVGVSFALLAREAVAAGRSGNQRKRWETYAKLYNKVKCSNWLEPGNGDWSTCLEKYTLCTDGMYHKEDCYGYKLPTYVQMLDLNSAEQNEYREIMARVADGEEGVSTESSMVEEKSSDDANGEVGKKEVASTRARLNNKVRLLREMLQWEQELRHEAATDGSVTVMDPEHPESAALMEVLVIRWPDGKIMRMPLGSTASDVSARAGLDARVVLINGKVAYPNTKLNDGDVVEIRSW
ncbi:hypothetical protein CBR_g26129 [Chara braunii]|uniref:Reverse transcriptase domain-containing protein n=1 Tax=Chara braunii TaxID=69332 RepID=A0A388JVZ3_CHABU|nr:hypothetical protein CBR_g26129 [Chara braunii]|eukprot:GBG61966.1 hypothetical protein CBR_g26129 [Chara braunii]